MYGIFLSITSLYPMLFSLVVYPEVELKRAKKNKTCCVCTYNRSYVYHICSWHFLPWENVYRNGEEISFAYQFLNTKVDKPWENVEKYCSILLRFIYVCIYDTL